MLVMRIMKSRVMARLEATGKAHATEDTTGFQDGEGEERLVEYMKTQILTEKLTMLPSRMPRIAGEIILTDANTYEVEDDVKMVLDS